MSGDTPTLLDLVEEAFDEIARTIQDSTYATEVGNRPSPKIAVGSAKTIPTASMRRRVAIDKLDTSLICDNAEAPKPA